MKILVTGAAGAIGSHLAERLASLGHEVIGIDAFTSYYSPGIKELNAKDVQSKGVVIYRKDLSVDDLGEFVTGLQIVFHLAAQPGISSDTPFKTYLDNNIVATYRMLEAVKECATLKMFFHISTSSVYGAHANGDETALPNPISLYGVTKLAAEQLALSYNRDMGMPVSVFRLFSVYGERERPDKFFHKLIKAIYLGEEVSLYEGSEHHVRSYTYVGDIVDGFILALSKIEQINGEVLNLGTDVTHTTGEGLRLVEKIMNKKARIKVLPPRKGDQVETSANIAKARSLLGYVPHTSLEDGLGAEVRWYRDNF